MNDDGPLGVKLEYFPIFIRTWNISRTETTENVCNRIIKEETKEGDKCFWELIPDEYVGPAEIFVSHAWSRPFTRITDLLLKGRIISRYNAKKFIWFDLFAVHQNGGQKQREDLAAIQLVIKKCSNTVLLLDQPRGDDQPLILTRMWCLYEIFKTQEYGGRFVIVFDNPLLSANPFPVLKIQDGNVTKQQDKDMILGEVGHKAKEVNLILNQILHQIWVIRMTSQVLIWWFGIWCVLISIVMAIYPTVWSITLAYAMFVCYIYFSFIIIWCVCFKSYRYSRSVTGWFQSRFAVTWFVTVIFYITAIAYGHKSNGKSQVDVPRWIILAVTIVFSICAVRNNRVRNCCRTEVGVIVGSLLWPIISISNYILDGWMGLSIFGHSVEFQALAVGDCVSPLVILVFSWFGYWRYRKLNNYIEVRSEPGYCWKILWSCITFGVEPLINPRFVLGMPNPNVGLEEPLIQ